MSKKPDFTEANSEVVSIEIADVHATIIATLLAALSIIATIILTKVDEKETAIFDKAGEINQIAQPVALSLQHRFMLRNNLLGTNRIIFKPTRKDYQSLKVCATLLSADWTNAFQVPDTATETNRGDALVYQLLKPFGAWPFDVHLTREGYPFKFTTLAKVRDWARDVTEASSNYLSVLTNEMEVDRVIKSSFFLSNGGGGGGSPTNFTAPILASLNAAKKIGFDVGVKLDQLQDYKNRSHMNALLWVAVFGAAAFLFGVAVPIIRAHGFDLVLVVLPFIMYICIFGLFAWLLMSLKQ